VTIPVADGVRKEISIPTAGDLLLLLLLLLKDY